MPIWIRMPWLRSVRSLTSRCPELLRLHRVADLLDHALGADHVGQLRDDDAGAARAEGSIETLPRTLNAPRPFA
jgi:hypothetical protein